jgi:sugar phosphate permease
MIDVWVSLNYVVGIVCVVVGLCMYFYPKESAKKFGVNLLEDKNEKEN